MARALLQGIKMTYCIIKENESGWQIINRSPKKRQNIYDICSMHHQREQFLKKTTDATAVDRVTLERVRKLYGVTYNKSNLQMANSVRTKEIYQTMAMCSYRSIHLTRNGWLHHENEPAIVGLEDTRWWYLNGRLHREDGPAVEYTDGTEIWYFNNQVHRRDGPAIKYLNGEERWFLYGLLHRAHDPNKDEHGPAVTDRNGNKYWYMWDYLHREDGPAIEYTDGTREWFFLGKAYDPLHKPKLEPMAYLVL